MGNSQDQIGMLAFVKISITPYHFLGYLGETDMEVFCLDKLSAMPSEEIASAQGQGMTGQNYYLVSCPKFLVANLRQYFPMGPLDEVLHQLERNGQEGYEAYTALVRSMDSIKQIFEHPTIQAAVDTFVLNKPDYIVLQVPAMAATSDSFEHFPTQLEELSPIFLSKASSPFQSRSGNGNGTAIVHEITTNQDK